MNHKVLVAFASKYGATEEIAGRIHPQDIILFHGSVDMEKVNFIERSMITNIESPVGDFRDWKMIGAWAEGIATELSEDKQVA